MLKSLSTQFIATLCFGPIGLVYSSMAAAVFLTLILAVLYFTEIGIAAVVIIWPIAIVAGLIFVKLHNDQIRSSGSTLLLGPDDEDQGLSAIGSWMRGIAVLALLGVGSYVVFSTNKEDFTDSVADRVADATAPGEDVKQVKQIEVLALARIGFGTMCPLFTSTFNEQQTVAEARKTGAPVGGAPPCTGVNEELPTETARPSGEPLYDRYE